MGSDTEPAPSESTVSADLVARIAAGDRSAEDEMYRRYARGLVFLIRQRTGDASVAEDLCHSTFVTAIEKLRNGEVKEPDRLAAFLRGVAENKLMGDWRRNHRRATTADSEAIERAIDERRSPLEEVSAEQTAHAVRALLNELPQERDREILISVYLRDEDKESICRRLNVDSTHFNRVLFRAKQRFAKIVERAEKKGRLRLVG